MGKDTTIRLKRKTKNRLDKLLEKKGETYNDLVQRLLDRVGVKE